MGVEGIEPPAVGISTSLNSGADCFTSKLYSLEERRKKCFKTLSYFFTLFILFIL